MSIAPRTAGDAPPRGDTAAGETVPITRLRARAYTVPTDGPEADGTLEWDSTTLVLVELEAGGRTGVGYTYAHAAAAGLIADVFGELLCGEDALGIPARRQAMRRAVRNLGRPGLCAMAIAAVDIALWDLKARLLDQPLAVLLGMSRAGVPVYGSGGFTSYPPARLQAQLQGWVDAGIPRVKMKIGCGPAADVERVRGVREAIGPDAELFVDANGAYERKQALALAAELAGQHVTWLEEPVTSDDAEGLRLLRDRAPAGIDIAAGEYGFGLGDFKRLLDAGAVDVLQADATRCEGISGFLEAAALCRAARIPLSSHCAPMAHLAACCALPCVRHMEYFHDHVRIERMLFDGAPEPVGGVLRPDLSRPGIGLEFRRADAEAFGR